MVPWPTHLVNSPQRAAARALPGDTRSRTLRAVENCDVLVIGGGAAGAAAALAAATAGVRVVLVRRGPGATALASGSWSAEPPRSLRDALARAGLELDPCNGPLPHPRGTIVSCAFAAASHVRATLTRKKTLVCGIAGLPTFRAKPLAALWAEAAAIDPAPLVPLTLTLADTPAAGWSPVSLAAALERDPARLARPLAEAARTHGADRAIVPAVLGLDDHARVLRDVEAGAGVEVGEALGDVPSVPGHRLDRALTRALAAAGVREVRGNVIGGTFESGSLTRVVMDRPEGRLSIGARAFVLATGKFLGGGISARDEYAEDALGLDVSIERFASTIDDPAASLMLTDPVRTEPQAVLATGVRTDDDGRPLTAAGDVHAVNVFTAGSVRAGTETAALGLAQAARDGHDAGERAARHAAR